MTTDGVQIIYDAVKMYGRWDLDAETYVVGKKLELHQTEKLNFVFRYVEYADEKNVVFYPAITVAEVAQVLAALAPVFEITEEAIQSTLAAVSAVAEIKWY